MEGRPLMSTFFAHNESLMNAVRTINQQVDINDTTLSLDALRDFLLTKDGRAKQSEVILHFPQLTSHDVMTKKQAREKFFHILNILTTAKEEGGIRYVYLVEQYRSNVAYRNANLQSVLDSREESLRAKQQEESQSLPVPLRRGVRRSSPNRPLSESSDSSFGSRRSSRRISTTDSSCSHEHKQRRLSAIAGLKNLFHVNAKSCDSVCSVESDCTSDDEIHPEESKWLTACHSGNLDEMKFLLKNSPHLLNHRDFIYGYTALHWAAKLGREDMVDFIASQQSDKEYLDIKSFGGHTALHISSECGRENVIVQLLELGANIHARDYGGRKAKDIDRNTVSATVQRKLGRPLVIDTNTVLTSGLSSIHSIKSNGQKQRAPRFSTAGITNKEPNTGKDDNAVKKRAKSVGAKSAPNIVLASTL